MNRPFSETENKQTGSIELFLTALKAEFQIDLFPYAELSLSRRLRRFAERVYAETPEELLKFLKTNPHLVEHFLNELPVRVTEMFRDPDFWRDIKYTVIPSLPQAQAKIWCAGCSTGEEAWSLAILLHSSAMLNKVESFKATDVHWPSLAAAKSGKISSHKFKIGLDNLDHIPLDLPLKNEAKQLPSGLIQIPEYIINKIEFKQEDLVNLSESEHYDLIICRNLLIYFKKETQAKIVDTFYQMLNPGGFLCLGSRESLIYSSKADGFEVISKENKVFRKR